MRRDVTALWRGAVAGLLCVLAAHACEESYSTGLLGQAVAPSPRVDCAAIADAEAERATEQGAAFSRDAAFHACEGK